MSAQATIENVAKGTRLVADDGFTCIPSGKVLTVKVALNGLLFVPCACGGHYLDGQLNDADEYVGFELAEPASQSEPTP